MDDDEATQRRLGLFEGLNDQTMRDLEQMLIRLNPFVNIFKQAREVKEYYNKILLKFKIVSRNFELKN